MNETIIALSKSLSEINKKSEEYIIRTMKDDGVSLISFVLNGNSNVFDVDNSYMSIDYHDEIVSVGVIAILLVEDTIYLLPDNAMGYLKEDTIDVLENNITLSESAIPQSVIDDLTTQGWLLDAIYSPSDTINQLLYSVSETLPLATGEE